MTFSTFASPGVAIQGGGGGGGGGAASAPLTGTGATVTTSQPLIDVSQTWNNGAVTFTGLKFNAAGTSDANSAAASLLMDLQVGGTSRFSVSKAGNVTLPSAALLLRSNGIVFVDAGQNNFNINVNGGTASGLNTVVQYIHATSILKLQSGLSLVWTSGDGNGVPDTILTRRAAANLRFGAADAAAPVAQTLSVQSVVAGTSNIAGANLTITGSQGTGTGAGGSIIFQVAPAGSSGSAQNALSTALTIDSTRLATFANAVRTSAPSGGTAANWKLGTVATVTATLPNRTIEVDIGGTIYYLHAKTTND
jgi:hypothetical protein